MALRTEQFRCHLEAHEYKQNGEGMCWPALVQAILHSQDSPNGNRQKIISEMGTTVSGGTDTDQVTAYFNRIGIRWHTEANCSLDRLVSLVEKLPIHVDILASVWDRRISPGYDEITDPPESHTVAILETPLVNGKRRVRFYDPSTYIGGIFDWSQEEWEKWWNDGPESGLEADNFGNWVPFEKAWLMVVGKTTREILEFL